jgi:hypothetical protein
MRHVTMRWKVKTKRYNFVLKPRENSEVSRAKEALHRCHDNSNRAAMGRLNNQEISAENLKHIHSIVARWPRWLAGSIKKTIKRVPFQKFREILLSKEQRRSSMEGK